MVSLSLFFYEDQKMKRIPGPHVTPMWGRVRAKTELMTFLISSPFSIFFLFQILFYYKNKCWTNLDAK